MHFSLIHTLVQFLGIKPLGIKRQYQSLTRGWLRSFAIAFCLLLLVGSTLAMPQPASANLPPGNAITDGRALLRYALPLDSKEIREVQKNIEDLSDELRAKRWRAMRKQVQRAAKVVNLRDKEILAVTPEATKSSVEAGIAELRTDLEAIATAIEAKDKEQTWIERRKTLDLVGKLEEQMVGGFPFEVPEEYANLPQLKGRATVELETTQGTITLAVDGYNAPVTAGNFVDLVQRGFYDGLPFTRADESYVLQVGDPIGPEDGFIDPETQEYRAIPLEIRVDGDEEPIYEEMLENLGIFNALPALPFSAYGTVGMARPNDDVNQGSSQFFFFLFEPEMTPAGLNLIDGRYAAFGYALEGKEVLSELLQTDKIVKARVTSGIENLVQPT